MRKQVYRLSDIWPKVLHAVDTLADPVKGTMSPKGRTVIYEDEEHALFVTKDGATIAKSIYVKDQVENAIIQILKSASLKTNTEAGDGTSGTVLLEQVLMHECYKLLDAGWNGVELKRELDKFRDNTIAALKKGAIQVKGDDDIYNIALVSASNDKDIAANVVKVIKTAKLDGMIFINGNNKLETELIEETGYKTEGGMVAPEFANQGRFNAAYSNVPVLITDKRIYYPEEAETILSTAMLAGHKTVVVVARDFIGASVNYFLANHGKNINVLLVKDTQVTEGNRDSVNDLAAYLGGHVVSEKNGSLVDNITADDFVMAEKVWADPGKGLFTSFKPNNKEVKKTIAALRAELKKDKDNDPIKRRLASLTNGMVTILVGGATAVEVKERVHRYEDAISAARAAVRDGYLVGGGLALYGTFDAAQYPAELVTLFRKFTSAHARQIADNCGEHAPTILAKTKGNVGYNAVSGQIEDLKKAGVFDPYKVVEMTVLNSVSVVGQIISSEFLVIEDEENNEKENE